MSWKLSTKINTMFVSIIMIFTVIIGVVVNTEVKEGIQKFAIEKAKSDLALGYEYIDQAYPGKWHIKDDQLYKGDTLFNNNFELIDELGNLTGDTVTIFQGDTRVTTNVIVDNQRAVGTQISEKVGTHVLQKAQPYYGEADVAGNTYQAAYSPIKDANGEVIGIFYVGAPESIIAEIINSILKSFIIVLVAVIILAVACITWFSNTIKKRLANVADALENASNGQFIDTLQDKAGDELTSVANSFNTMTNSVASMMHEVDQHSTKVEDVSHELTKIAESTSAATAQVSTTINEIAVHVSEQQQMIEQSTIAIQEVTIGIGQVSDNTMTIAENSTTMIDKAQTGQQSVTDVIGQMERIQTSNNETNVVIETLAHRSQEITQIIQLISDIANQTNLLALNAAIEAARAGEAGKGFAVVADEVRKLAEQSNHSAQSIQTIIQHIQSDTANAMQSMQKTEQEITSGMHVVHETGEAFTHIYDSITETNVQIQELSAICEEMSASMEEISASMTEVEALSASTAQQSSAVSQTTAHQEQLSEQVMETAQHLATRAKELHDAIEMFEIK